ncbi:MAG TPA: hypothetical protein VF487_17280 [Chitinophagaceae bacterium]
MKPPPTIYLSIASTLILSVSAIKGTSQTISSNNDLFESDDSMTIYLKGDVRDLLKDRTGSAKKFPFTLSYYKKDADAISIPVELKTRGHFRRLKENCNYPPLMIEFPSAGANSATVFKHQKKIKLVMPCKGEEYIIREWLVYKMYNLLTPLSFRSRLVKVKLEDSNNRKTATVFYGLLLEDENQMAERNKTTIIKSEKRVSPQQIKRTEFLTMAVFQYLAGNTDWSVQYLQNIRLLAEDAKSMPIAVPYDFDHAGIVNAPYAFPTEELQMSSIRQRRYRGYCMADLTAFEDIIKKFNDLKKEIYKLYTDCSLLDAKYIKSTIQYLDEFYATINNTKAWQKDFAYPCDKNGTGNVVIKGLKEN